MADVIEKDLTKVTSSDLTPITKPSSGTDKRYMRMVDKDGNSVDVEVSAFLRAAIRDELASILESGGTGGGSVLSVIGGVLKTRTDADLASVLGVPNTRTYYAGNSARLIKVSGFVLTSNDCYLIFIFGEHNTDKSGFFCLSNSHPGNGMNIGKVYAAANEWEFYKDSSGNYYIKIATWGQVNISIYKSTHNITTEMIAYDTTGLTPVTVIE